MITSINYSLKHSVSPCALRMGKLSSEETRMSSGLLQWPWLALQQQYSGFLSGLLTALLWSCLKIALYCIPTRHVMSEQSIFHYASVLATAVARGFMFLICRKHPFVLKDELIRPWVKGQGKATVISRPSHSHEWGIRGTHGVHFLKAKLCH